DEQFNPDDEVRIMDEVDGDPAIKAATLQGKKFSDLSESEQASLQAKNYQQQETVKQGLNSNNITMEYKESFATVFNSFSGTITYKDFEQIESLPGVANVTISTEYDRPEAEPDMHYSKEIVEAQKTWDDYG